MESQLGLRLPLWACFVLALTGCESSESETEGPSTTVPGIAPGIDPFCATRPKIEFCEDFDTDDVPGAFDENITHRATLTLDGEEASSLPRSLIISVEAGGHGQLKKTFEPGGKLRLFGMLYVAEFGQGDVEIASFELGDYRVGFGASEDGSLWGFEGDERIPGDGTLPTGRWASFRWDVNTYDDGTGTANLRFGFDEIINTDEIEPPAGFEGSPSVTVGLSAATGAWSMQFDTLTVGVGEATP